MLPLVLSADFSKVFMIPETLQVSRLVTLHLRLASILCKFGEALCNSLLMLIAVNSASSEGKCVEL